MPMKLPISITIFLVAATALITYQATYTTIEKKHSETVYTLTESDSKYKKLDAVDEIVRASYIKDIDEVKLEDGLIRGYLYGIEDKYASYLTSDEHKRYTDQSNGSQVGIGVTIIYDSDMDGLYVTSVENDSPAMNAGIRPGDILYAVDGEKITEKGYYETLTYIAAGKEGEKVTITVKKGPEHTLFEDYDVTRAIITTHTVEYEMYGTDVGYIRISSFHGTTPVEFITAVQNLQNSGAEKFVFDLRDNPGGELTSISTILDLLLPEGPIIRIHTRDEGETVLSSDEKCIDVPMAVIINRNTASAAELFASALKDYGKATLVGETTYGKGTMQTMIPLPSDIGGGAVSVSTGMYNPPFSDNYEGKGVVPDVEAELPQELAEIFYKLEPGQDPQFLAALKTLPPSEENTEAPAEVTSSEAAS